MTDARSDPLYLALKRRQREEAIPQKPPKKFSPIPVWKPEEVLTLEKMWAEGKSAREIGDVLGRTRNAVIGRAHRMKLASREDPSNRLKAKGNPHLMKKPKTPKPKLVPVPVIKPDAPAIRADAFAALPTSHPATMADATGCLWPIGDSNLFCNAHKGDKEVYCTHHRQRASHAVHYRKKAA